MKLNTSCGVLDGQGGFGIPVAGLTSVTNALNVQRLISFGLRRRVSVLRSKTGHTAAPFAAEDVGISAGVQDEAEASWNPRVEVIQRNSGVFAGHRQWRLHLPPRESLFDIC